MRYHATMNHHTYRAEWCPEHGEYVARCVELQWLSRWAPTLQEATKAIEQAVDEFIAERKANGDEVPVPLTERQYSGKFVVRTSPALHARLVVVAAEQNVSMNQWVVQKLSGRVDQRLGDLFGFD
jgi:predicted HicB family RNase H-like nuclease